MFELLFTFSIDDLLCLNNIVVYGLLFSCRFQTKFSRENLITNMMID